MEKKFLIAPVKANTKFDINYYSWIASQISHILRNPFYKGAHLVFRTHQKGICSNTYNIIPCKEWEVIKNYYKAIISPEELDKIENMIDRRPPIMQGNTCPFYNLFQGRVLSTVLLAENACKYDMKR